MFKEGDVVCVKTLEKLVKEGNMVKDHGLGDVYYNEDKKFILFSDFQYYGKECTIDEVDGGDPIPYFLSIGIWVPEFMIETKYDPKKADEAAVEVKEVPNIINKFSNKPFGKLFIKLIKFDAKIAEFSSTSFSKLKKHELQYIAKLLQDHGCKAIDNNKATQKELAVYCYEQTLSL